MPRRNTFSALFFMGSSFTVKGGGSRMQDFLTIFDTWNKMVSSQIDIAKYFT